MEAFFVVVMAAVLAGVGVWALTAIKHARTLTAPRDGRSSTSSASSLRSDRRRGED